MPRRSAAAILALLTAAAARADVHPNTQTGFPADQVFQVGEIDNVNLFNGALTLTMQEAYAPLYTEMVEKDLKALAEHLGLRAAVRKA